MRRVVVTGMGLVTPLACGVEESWRRILDGQSGAGTITRFDASKLATDYACEVPVGDGSDGTFNADDWMAPKERRKVDDFILYGIAAADQAVHDAGWTPDDEESLLRTGVMIGSGIGGLRSIEETTLLIRDKGPRRVSPFFIPGALINLISGQVSIQHGFKGPNHAVVTACSTGAHAIGDAARLIQHGDADVMVAGGAEAAICEIGIAGFNACKALSTKRSDDPKAASRPYDVDRDGFVMGEGAGVVVLEDYEHAKARGAKIYAEVLGYGLSGDAYHITAPSEDGDGGLRAMQGALRNAGVDPAEVDYINAHGTSTMADTIELQAVERLLGNSAANASMTSTKSATGHLLGAAGAIEAIFSILAVRDQVVPPTINLDNPAVETPLDLAPNAARERKVTTAMSNSFGFGGTNASLCLGAPR
ncbi:beta-ketoacyl-ACP synthase II [Roseovarius salinarum]|uniref:beta-ketoacyl-ACP synthase II n=1 Tax=Roseovarius salinarum TaxID=1981892 RepID=UPI000C31BDF5|nr:beta-ketoacyl-ACP synthase II [Roseovarius salinarum]